MREEISEKHLAIALERVKHFEHVAVQEALTETIAFLCEDWNWTVCTPTGHARSAGHILVDRIGDDELLKAKLEEHYYDFKLYDECLKIAREQNRGRHTPALDAIPDNMYEYEMHLVREHTMKESAATSEEAQQGQWLHRRTSAAVSEGPHSNGTSTFTFTALHFTEEVAAAVAQSFDLEKSKIFERNRAIAYEF